MATSVLRKQRRSSKEKTNAGQALRKRAKSAVLSAPALQKRGVHCERERGAPRDGNGRGQKEKPRTPSRKNVYLGKWGGDRRRRKGKSVLTKEGKNR